MSLIYVNRAPTDAEFFEKVLGLVAVFASAVTLSVIMFFLLTSVHHPLSLWLTPVSGVLLFVGWEVQKRPLRASLNYAPILIIAIDFTCLCLFGGVGNAIFADVIAIIAAVFIIPDSIFATLKTWRGWRSAEGSTKGKRSSVPVELVAGVVRPQQGDYKEKFRAAEDIFDNACFRNEISQYPEATRATLHWCFDEGGLSSETFELLRGALTREPERGWNILVMLIRALPEEPQQPAVVVIIGDDLDSMVVEDDAINLHTVDFTGEIPTSSIRDIVAYRW